MNRNKLNKKLVNNLILGSFLLGAFDGMISIVQATSMPPNQEQDVHQYDKKATEQLRALRSKLAPIEEWIKLIDREKGADPNGQVGLLVPLEEAILHSNSKAVEILIQKGADLNRSVSEREVLVSKTGQNGERIIEDARERYGRILLHVAVHDPDEMRELWKSHANSLGIDQIAPKQYYASVKIVELLLKNMPLKKIRAMKNCLVELTPLNWARSSHKRILDKIKKGEYDANEYDPIQKEYEAIVNLLERHAPPQRPPCAQRIPSDVHPIPCTLFRSTKK
jgi:hypothetical protein